MDKIAFVIDDTFLYWNSLMLTLGAAVAICFFLAFYLEKGGKLLSAAAVIPLAVVLSLVLSRFVHWYCRSDSYDGFLAAMTNYSVGGFALMGTFAGCFLAAGAVHLLGLEYQLGRLLDAMCLGGSAGIALGRLGCFYTAADRGQILQSVTSLPWAYPVVNTVSGAVEYRLATFVLQAMVTGLIFLGLAAFSRYRARKPGDITWLFLLLYGSAQVVLDSTRYDSLFMRSNGFISFVQVLGAVCLAASSVVFCVRCVRTLGFRKWYPAVWAGMAGLVGLAGYMEYYVQRHGDRAAFAYTVMSISLGILAAIAIGFYAPTCRKRIQES